MHNADAGFSSVSDTKFQRTIKGGPKLTQWIGGGGLVAGYSRLEGMILGIASISSSWLLIVFSKPLNHAVQLRDLPSITPSYLVAC